MNRLKFERKDLFRRRNYLIHAKSKALEEILGLFSYMVDDKPKKNGFIVWVHLLILNH